MRGIYRWRTLIQQIETEPNALKRIKLEYQLVAKALGWWVFNKRDVSFALMDSSGKPIAGIPGKVVKPDGSGEAAIQIMT